MPKVVRVFDPAPLIDGVPYRVQVCGRRAGTVWEGWIEFESPEGEWLRTPRETTQPDRAALEYWAGGLSATYLEGAFARAVNPPPAPPPIVVAAPHFTGPAERPAADVEVASDVAILDPFAVGAKGETLLRQELGALRGWHLRNIIRAYELADESINLEGLTEQELTELIVDAVAAA